MRLQGLEPLYYGSLVNQTRAWCAGLLGAAKLAGNVIDPPTWCGAATTLCTGDVETPSFVEKLLSGTRGQGDRDCVHERDLVAE